jgi:DnaJ-class molecular chaperone
MNTPNQNNQFKPAYIPIRCPNCKGRGRVNWDKEKCISCEGSGILKVPPAEGEGDEELYKNTK